MEKLSPVTPSVSKSSPDFTPKRNLIPKRPMTPLQMIKEEDKEQNKRNQSTPIRWNPFDMKAEALYLPACSPSVFATFQRNKVDNGTFRWSIEHLSVLYPADIDETSVPDTWVDAEQEVKAQKAIDTFFSQNSIVPSPWSSSPKEGRGDKKSRRRACISNIFPNVESNEVSTQTMLSIPPNIDLSKILGNFFTYDDSEDKNSKENPREEIDLSTSSLRRKLFANDEDECTSPSRIENKNLHFAQRMSTPTVHMRSVHSTPASDILSSSPITPPNCSDSCNILSSPPVSPIAATPFAGNQLTSYDNPKPNSPSPTEHDETTTEIAMSFCVDSQDTNQFPMSNRSERQDTGYATSSSYLSSQNMTSSMFNYGPVSRITPVTELMEECELSNSTCDMSYRSDTFAKGPQPADCNFKTYPWVPTCCSTPAQCNHL
ncbi:hypothetical protein JTE90_011741 [Oedothorax gibbosus]|uniref:Protein aurora borealis n=1 Tax=Oedothorax gibbosus TaxID=931172 RepID=A0AAV6U206_9ARAC|nr:hypothetical protein JTE90_011741 [Oedothorax gibbosus]